MGSIILNQTLLLINFISVLKSISCLRKCLRIMLRHRLPRGYCMLSHCISSTLLKVFQWVLTFCKLYDKSSKNVIRDGKIFGPEKIREIDSISSGGVAVHLFLFLQVSNKLSEMKRVLICERQCEFRLLHRPPPTKHILTCTYFVFKYFY